MLRCTTHCAATPGLATIALVRDIRVFPSQPPRCKIRQSWARGDNVKKFAAFLLLAVAVTCSVPTQAKDTNPDARVMQKAMKKQQKEMKKFIKRQQKAQKKAQKDAMKQSRGY
jgi:hypothetical protein